MPKSINIIRRIGSKQNDIKHFKDLLPLEVATVVEPFGGSFAVSKFFYKDIYKYKFHINDFDPALFYIYKHFEEYLNEILKLELIFKNLEGDYIGKQLKELIIKSNIDPYMIDYIIHNYFVRGNLFKATMNKNYDENERNILNNALFTNDDYMDIFDKYKEDDKAFIFLDPPYLFSDNSGYFPQNEDKDMTHILIDILDLLKNGKCRVMLIINKLDIMKYLYNDFIKGEYTRTYQLSNKKMKHLIITNY